MKMAPSVEILTTLGAQFTTVAMAGPTDSFCYGRD